ncbi:hypothetical protein [Halalkalicoccus salilacus]|uniref:hypothetical protein n=1 Tax=Halalkalicoccus TaxID=332246 RepID=UPI002F9637B9
MRRSIRSPEWTERPPITTLGVPVLDSLSGSTRRADAASTTDLRPRILPGAGYGGTKTNE